MERTAEYPWGRCSGCGYSGNDLASDHAYADHDYLCAVCLANFNKESPWCVDKVERKTGEVFSQWRHSSESRAADCLARLNSNPEAKEGKRFVFRMYKEDKEQS